MNLNSFMGKKNMRNNLLWVVFVKNSTENVSTQRNKNTNFVLDTITAIIHDSCKNNVCFDYIFHFVYGLFLHCFPTTIKQCKNNQIHKNNVTTIVFYRCLKSNVHGLFAKTMFGKKPLCRNKFWDVIAHYTFKFMRCVFLFELLSFYEHLQ